MHSNEKSEPWITSIKHSFLRYILPAIVVISGIILIPILYLGMIHYCFENEVDKNSTDFFAPFEFFTIQRETPLSFSISPWTQYKQKNVHALSTEQEEFLREKQLAECMTELMNYDEEIVTDSSGAIATIYDQFRILTTDDGGYYYVLYKVKIAHVYLFALIDMEGELFSFHFVSDYEYDDGGYALQYVENSYNDDNDIFGISLHSSENNLFNSIDLFSKTANNTWDKYHYLNKNLFIQNTNFYFYIQPDKIFEENGSIIICYVNEQTQSQHVYLFIDKQTKQLTGYHLEKLTNIYNR